MLYTINALLSEQQHSFLLFTSHQTVCILLNELMRFNKGTHHHHQCYSPCWSLPSFTTLLQLAPSSALPVQPSCMPLSLPSSGKEFLFQRSCGQLLFKHVPAILPSDLSQTLYHALQSIYLVLCYSVLSPHLYPIQVKIFLNILLSKYLRAFSSAAVSDHFSAPYVMTVYLCFVNTQGLLSNQNHGCNRRFEKTT
jgi:hypothetical protein